MAAIGAAVVAQVKSRWDSEETAMMAMEEARLRSLGAINQSLVATMPDRTLEAIKGHRRRPDYKSLVELYTVSTPPEAVQAEVMADPRPGSTDYKSLVELYTVSTPPVAVQAEVMADPRPGSTDYKSLVELYTVSTPCRPEAVQAEVMADPRPGSTDYKSLVELYTVSTPPEAVQAEVMADPRPRSTAEGDTMIPVESPPLATRVTRDSKPSPPPPPPDVDTSNRMLPIPILTPIPNCEYTSMIAFID